VTGIVENAVPADREKDVRYMDSEIFNEDYFLRGKQTGKSLYENYRYIPELSIPMVQAIVSHLGIIRDDTILDFGCALGFVVKAFRAMKYRAFGVDVSRWAIDNCDPEVREFIQLAPWVPRVDWIIAKDVLEHIEIVDSVIKELMANARKGVLAVVPLANREGGKYAVVAYERDVTHIHRLTLGTWSNKFIAPGWTVTSAFRVKGIKDNYFDGHMEPAYMPDWDIGNGFVTARRI